MKPHHDVKAYLFEILESAKAISAYTKNLSFEDFVKSDITKDAVLMRLTVIGESASKIDSETAKNIKDIPFVQIRATRNRIVHEYGKVRFNIIWNTANDDIPALIAALERYFDRHA